MQTVLIAGAFGQGNPGDEALLHAFRRALPEDHLVVTSGDPRRTRAQHGCDAFPITDQRAALQAIKSAQAVVVGGGTIFKRLHPSTQRRPHGLLASTFAMVVAARVRRRPVALVGVGAGDVTTPTAARLARGIVDRSDLLLLRDEESALTLERIGARPPFRVGADPVWSLVDEPRTAVVRAGERSGRVVVALSHHASAEPHGFSRSLASGLAALTRDHQQKTALAPIVDLQPWQTADVALARDVERQLDGCARARIVDPPATFEDAVTDFVGADVVIGLRFHALVAAAAAARPFVAVAHEAKLAGLARRLGQPAVLPTEVGLDNLAQAVDLAIARGPASTAAVEQEIRRAEDGFRLLRLLLARGHEDDLATLPTLDLVPERWMR